MRRINIKRHKTLVKTLQDLDKIVSDKQTHTFLHKDRQKIQDAINLLTTTYRRYEALHQQLSLMTDDYNRLYKELSTQMLAPTLRSLKKEIEDNSPFYFLFREILQETKGL